MWPSPIILCIDSPNAIWYNWFTVYTKFIVTVVAPAILTSQCVESRKHPVNRLAYKRNAIPRMPAKSNYRECSCNSCFKLFYSDESNCRLSWCKVFSVNCKWYLQLDIECFTLHKISCLMKWKYLDRSKRLERARRWLRECSVLSR